MKKRLLFLAATALSINAFAQTDVTSTYLKNAGFDSGSCWQTSNVATASSANSLAVDEWTSNGGAAWCSSASFAIGSDGQINGAAIPTANADGGTDGGVVAFSVGWGSEASYTQTVKLPAGTYNITYAAYNSFTATAAKCLIGFYPTSGTNQVSTKTSFATNKWETETISFELAEETEGTIKVGFKAIDGGSSNHAKVSIDYIKITSGIDLTNWTNAKAEAQALLDANKDVTGDARTALENAVNVADPTTVSGMEAAIAAINSAKTTFEAAVTQYNLEQTLAAYKTAKETYTVDVTSLINSDITTWTNTNITTNKGQHWDGTTTSIYYEQKSGWSLSSWTAQAKKEVTLPAGKYALIASGRGSSGAALTMSVGEISSSFAMRGDNGKGIATDGTATYADDATYANNNAGRGWEWRALEFESDGTTATTITFDASASALNKWVSFTSVQLFTTSDNALVKRQAAVAELNTWLSVVKRYEGYDKENYPKVTDFLAKITECKAAIEDDSKTADDITTLTNELKAAAAAVPASFTVEGVDVSSVILNNSFTSTDNWTVSVGKLATGNEVGEVYNQLYDVNQTVSVPNGTYYVSANAFQRSGLGGTDNAAYNNYAAGTETITGYLYANDESTLLKSLYSEYAYSKISNEQACEGVYFANDLKAADNHFNTLKLYNNLVKVTVTDGTLKLGVKCETAGANGYWTAFDNFQLHALSYTFDEAQTNNVVATEGIDVTANRKLVGGVWNTLCLPFSIGATQLADVFGAGVVVKQFDKLADNVIYFKGATSIEAGQAYIIKPADDVEKIEVKGATVTGNAPTAVAEGESGMQGTYSPTTISESNLFLGANNKLYYPQDATAQMKGMRAYFVIASGTSAKNITLNLDGDVTGIESVNGASIMEQGKVYNLNGQLVGKSLKDVKKGVYIVNGKKVQK